MTSSPQSQSQPQPADPAAPRIVVVLDCGDVKRAAAFWSAALSYRPFGSAGQYRSLVPADGVAGPKLILQQVQEPKASKNRMHFDLAVEDIEVEAARLRQLGASVLSRQTVEEHGTRWRVMADPDGNEFCVVQG